MTDTPNTVAHKSYAFALDIIKLNKTLNTDRRECVLSKQILRSGTSIGALIREAEHGRSKSAFLTVESEKLKVESGDCDKINMCFQHIKKCVFLSKETLSALRAFAVPEALALTLY